MTDYDQIGFLHIPKTGGRTMYHILLAQFPPEQVHEIVQLGRPQIKPGARLVLSHFPYDAFPPNENRRVLTLLRHPAQRVASYYQMCLRSGSRDYPGYDAFWAGGQPMPLLEFASGKLGMLDQIDNAMVRQLCNFQTMINQKPVTEKHVALAKQHLSTLLFGFTERFDDFVTTFCDEFGWQKPAYEPVNISPDYRVSRRDMRELERLNWADMELYTWAIEHYAC